MTSYFSSVDGSFRELPKAKFYVLSNDRFMSGWGHAKGKINTCIVPCESYEQAGKVLAYVITRNDQKRARIACEVRTKNHAIYSLVVGWLRLAGVV